MFVDNIQDDERWFCELEDSLGYKFHDRDLLREAMMHPSIGWKYEGINYERLEFLGDAVLCAAISDILFHTVNSFDNSGNRYDVEMGRHVVHDAIALSDDLLSTARTKLVSGVCIASVGKKLGIGDYVIMSHGEESIGGRSNDSNIENVMEALIAAIYLDGGWNALCNFVYKHWYDLICNPNTYNKDAKTRLYEWVQAERLPNPVYTVLSNHNINGNEAFFEVSLFIEGIGTTTASGQSKKHAEKAASEAFLNKYQK